MVLLSTTTRDVPYWHSSGFMNRVIRRLYQSDRCVALWSFLALMMLRGISSRRLMIGVDCAGHDLSRPRLSMALVVGTDPGVLWYWVVRWWQLFGWGSYWYTIFIQATSSCLLVVLPHQRLNVRLGLRRCCTCCIEYSQNGRPRRAIGRFWTCCNSSGVCVVLREQERRPIDGQLRFPRPPKQR